ncbi:MAG: ABC transporter permease [Epulopiscium sp.]|uniref:ABC transporter permease n=1 Tax=Clostridium sp. Cult1 TaxID=2079002 RepID=UPI00169B3505|nr:ABC transporter permease [Clostridium sp. Cult1]MCF6462594.1 ribose ABC transporter permease [Clostridium sp. Cult1]NLI90569.1 ABC transporter permease [Candidatus Epulonipiscium sp.]
MLKTENKNKKSFIEWFKHRWTTEPLFSTAIALLIMIVIQTVVLGFDYDSFGSWFSSWIRNWINILRNNAGVGIISLGMTFVIISGGIDLAVGSTLVAVGAIIMMLIDTGPKGILAGIGLTGAPAFAVAILIAIAIGCLFGTGIGLLITKGKIPPFIATLGAMKIFRSLTQHFMQGYNPTVPKGFLQISSFKIGNLMLMPIIYWAIAAFILNYVSKRTVFGRQVIAVGSNERAAKLSGINVVKVKTKVYSLMGVLVAIAAIIQVSRIGSMDFANAGSGSEMDAIAAAVVGGTSMSGGKGTIIGTVFGMLIIAVMNNLLNLFGVPPFLREAFKGMLVVFAVLLQRKEES